MAVEFEADNATYAIDVPYFFGSDDGMVQEAASGDLRFPNHFANLRM